MALLKHLTTLLACSLAGMAHAGDGLLDIYLLAQQNDAELQVAEARYQAAAQGDSIALSNWLPHIAFEYNLSETRQSVAGESFGRSGHARFTTRNDRLTFTQTLYHHDLYVELDRAGASTARALAQRDAARQKLVVRTAEAYFDVLAAQDGTLFSRKEKDAIALQLEQAEARFQVGLTAIVEVKETQASYDLAVAREIEAQNLLENQLEALAVITGHPHQSLSPLSDRLRPIPPKPANIQDWTEAALEHNLNYLIQKHTLDVARHTVRFEQAKHWPTLDLHASLNDTEDTGGVFSPAGSKTHADRVSIQLKVPLLAGGETYYRTRQAIYEREAAQAELLATQRKVEQDVRSAYRDVTAGTSRVRAFERALESARVDLEAHQAGLEAGTRDTVDVVQATSRLYAAERDYSQARYDYIVDTLRLRQATGQLSLEDIEWANSLLD